MAARFLFSKRSAYHVSQAVLASAGCGFVGSYFYKSPPTFCASAEIGNDASAVAQLDKRMAEFSTNPYIKVVQRVENSTLPEWAQKYFVKDEYFEVASHGYRAAPGDTFAHVLHDTLREHNGISDMQYFIDAKKTHVLFICTVGPASCGHKGVAHGGFTATVIDNVLGALAFAFCDAPCATKSLAISYKAPVMAYETFLLSGELQEGTSSKKALLKATLYGKEGKVRVEADGVFVNIGNRWKDKVEAAKERTVVE